MFWKFLLTNDQILIVKFWGWLTCLYALVLYVGHSYLFVRRDCCRLAPDLRQESGLHKLKLAVEKSSSRPTFTCRFTYKPMSFKFTFLALWRGYMEATVSSIFSCCSCKRTLEKRKESKKLWLTFIKMKQNCFVVRTQQKEENAIREL